MKYVEVDESTGAVSWERYFEYLQSMQPHMPPQLYAYAIQWEHYSLDSVNSLHDAWLTCARFGYRDRDLSLEFLGPWHDRTQVFRYVGVKSYAFEISVDYRPGDSDVLAHEFRVEDGRVAHEIMFSNRRCISVVADNVLIRTDLHASEPAAKN